MAYTKVYRGCNHQEDKTYNYITAKLSGYKIITDSYGHEYVPPPRPQWPNESIYYDARSTRVVFHADDQPAHHRDVVEVGWTTPYHNCQLEALYWSNSQGNFVANPGPQQAGGQTPGGGVLTRDPLTGEVVWVITNQTEGTLDLSSMVFGIVYATRAGENPARRINAPDDPREAMQTGMMTSIRQSALEDLRQEFDQAQAWANAARDLIDMLEEMAPVSAQELSAPKRAPARPVGFDEDTAGYVEWPVRTLDTNSYTALAVASADGWPEPTDPAHDAYYMLEGVLTDDGGEEILRWAELCDPPK